VTPWQTRPIATQLAAEPADDTEEAEVRTQRASSRVPWRALGLGAVIVVPIIVAMVAAPTKEWFPTSDYALIELSTRDVGSHTPLVGPFSRYGWNHPGPMLFWLLAGPYRALGSHSWAMFLGAGVMNIATIAAILWVAFRRGRWPFLVLTGFALTLLLRGLGGTFLVDPWNPSITLLPFVLLMLLAWSLTLGSYRLAPVTVLVAMFVGQTHIGYVPVALVATGWGFALLAWRLWVERRDEPDRWAAQRKRVAAWIAAAVVVGAVCVAPMVVEQLTVEPGNLTQLYHHFTSNDEGVAGFGRATSITARHLSPTAPWVSGHEPDDPFTGDVVGAPRWWALLSVGVFAAAFVVAWRRRDREAVLLQATVALALAAGVFAVARTTGDTYTYLFNWMRALGMLVWLSAAWSGFRALPPASSARVRSVGGPVLVAGTALASLAAIVPAATFDVPYKPYSAAMRDVREPTAEAVGDSAVLIGPVGDCWAEVLAGVALDLEKRGVVVKVRPELEYQYGRHRIWDGTNADRQLTVGCRDGGSRTPPEGRGELVAYSGSFTPEQDQRYDELFSDISAQLVANGREDLLTAVPSGWIAVLPDSGVDQELLDEFAELAPFAEHRTATYLGPIPEE
jgi:hypothetical protein